MSEARLFSDSSESANLDEYLANAAYDVAGSLETAIEHQVEPGSPVEAKYVRAWGLVVRAEVVLRSTEEIEYLQVRIRAHKKVPGKTGYAPCHPALLSEMEAIVSEFGNAGTGPGALKNLLEAPAADHVPALKPGSKG